MMFRSNLQANLTKTLNFIEKKGSDFNYNDYWLRKNGKLKHKGFFSRIYHHYKPEKTFNDILAVLERVEKQKDTNKDLLKHQIVPVRFLLSRSQKLEQKVREDEDFRIKFLKILNMISEIEEISPFLVPIPSNEEEEPTSFKDGVLNSENFQDGFIKGRLLLALGINYTGDNREVNPKGLSKAPIPILSLQELFSEEELEQINEIALKTFEDTIKAVFPRNYNESDKNLGYYVTLHGMYQDIKNRSPDKSIKSPKQFYTELEFVVKAMMFLTKNQDLQTQRGELIGFAQHGACKPTWLQYGTGRVKELKGVKDKNECEQQILTFCQEAKERIILEEWPEKEERLKYTAWENQWHGLNWMRHHLGEELGLDVNAAKYDNYKERLFIGEEYHDFPFSIEEARQCFLEDFTAEKLIEEVQNRLNDMKHPKGEDLIAGYLMSLPLLNVLAEPESFIQENLYDYGTKQITEKGVILILQALELLKF